MKSILNRVAFKRDHRLKLMVSPLGIFAAVAFRLIIGFNNMRTQRRIFETGLNQKSRSFLRLSLEMAEKEGFEPSIGLYSL